MSLQHNFDLIPRQAQGTIIYQRPKDGYIDATAMCQAAGKRWNHYASNETTKAFIRALAAEAGIPATELVQSVIGGLPGLQGTWVHPQVAINLAQWLSPEFAVKVSGWVYEWLSGRGKTAKAELPYHLRRYAANMQNVPAGHWSMLMEMTTLLIAPLELSGYTIPERMLPDISEGKMFCKWLRDKHGVDTDALPTYLHVYEDGRVVRAKAYPDSLLSAFRQHFRGEWLRLKAEQYFRERDPDALVHLPRLLPPPKKH
jgi:hypothetical protein